MKNFILILISLLPPPAIMIIFGLLWKNHPPKSINWLYGYRSSRSMKDEETWKFAHEYQGRLWRWTGSLLLVLILIYSLLFTKSYKEIPSWVFYGELVILILTIIPTEIALWRKFDKDGNEI